MENVYTIETYLNAIEHSEYSNSIQKILIGFYNKKRLLPYSHFIYQRILFNNSTFHKNSSINIFLLNECLFSNLFDFVTTFHNQKNIDPIFLKVKMTTTDVIYNSCYQCLFIPVIHDFLIPTNNHIDDFKKLFRSIKDNKHDYKFITTEITELEAQKCGVVNIIE